MQVVSNEAVAKLVNILSDLAGSETLCENLGPFSHISLDGSDHEAMLFRMVRSRASLSCASTNAYLVRLVVLVVEGDPSAFSILVLLAILEAVGNGHQPGV